MNDGTKISELKINETPLLECESCLIKEYFVKLFWVPRDYKNGGFDFFCAEFNSGPATEGDCFLNPESTVDNLCSGIAFFDGVRHISWGDEKGYMNYPNMKTIAAVCEKLRELEVRLCSKDDLDD